MKFRKINDTTVNCIITQDDMKKHGIDLDDLFERKKNAVDFIKGIIVKAANTVNLNIKSDYTAMKISVLPDKSVSLTISQDPTESDRIREIKGAAPEEGAPAAAESRHTAQGRGRGSKPAQGVYVFEFGSMRDMMSCCRMLLANSGPDGSVYYVKETGMYYLILDKGTGPDSGCEGVVLKAGEFGKMVTCDEKTLAYIKEHCRCIIAKNAVSRISEL